jgi:hypothetical protein
LTAAAAAVLCALTAGVWGFPAPQGQPPARPQPKPTPAAQPPAAAERAATAPQRLQAQQCMKQILLAMHNYHDANEQFPRDITDKDGKPLLSWRVAILPFIEEEKLFKQFKFDEPWDSDHNKKLLDKMPAVYRLSTQGKDETKTYFQGFSGPGAMFEPGKKISVASIRDGTSNTVAVVAAGPPAEWTKPADLPYHPKLPLVKFEGPFSNVLLAATSDGAVHSLKRDLDEKTLRLLIERDDGQPIDLRDAYAKFLLDKEGLQGAQETLKQNERLITAIAEQLREQQKLLVELGKKRNPDDPIKGIDLEKLAKLQLRLEEALEHLRKETEELRKEATEKK